jgi:hypothetical protein
MQIGKEEIKLFLLAGDMILYLKDPTNYIKKLLEIINCFGKIARYKVNIEKSVTFFTYHQ